MKGYCYHCQKTRELTSPKVEESKWSDVKWVTRYCIGDDGKPIHAFHGELKAEHFNPDKHVMFCLLTDDKCTVTENCAEHFGAGGCKFEEIKTCK